MSAAARSDPAGAPIYLDHNATTPIHPEVRRAMVDAMSSAWGNPSSGHVYGRRAHEAVERARAEVAALIGAHEDEIVFTSGGTEANNLAIRGSVGRRPGAIVISAIEHPATREPAARLGRELRVLPVDREGRVEVTPGALEGAALVSVMHANNETGVLQPIREIAGAARELGALVHTDAAQSAGKVPVHVRELGVDLLSIAGHKLYAPKGVGALFVRRGLELDPILFGASHERGLRPGTENVLGAVGLGAACALARGDLEREAERVRALRDELIERLRASIPALVVHGEAAPRLPNTASARFPGVRGQDLLAGVPGIAASTGSACHDGVDAPSAVVVAMGVPPDEAMSTVRLSLGRGTTLEDVVTTAELLAAAWRRLCA